MQGLYLYLYLSYIIIIYIESASPLLLEDGASNILHHPENKVKQHCTYTGNMWPLMEWVWRVRQRLHSLGAKAGKHIYTNPHTCTNTDIPRHKHTQQKLKELVSLESRMDRRRHGSQHRRQGRDEGREREREKEEMQKSLNGGSGREGGGMSSNVVRRKGRGGGRVCVWWWWQKTKGFSGQLLLLPLSIVLRTHTHTHTHTHTRTHTHTHTHYSLSSCVGHHSLSFVKFNSDYMADQLAAPDI